MRARRVASLLTVATVAAVLLLLLLPACEGTSSEEDVGVRTRSKAGTSARRKYTLPDAPSDDFVSAGNDQDDSQGGDESSSDWGSGSDSDRDDSAGPPSVRLQQGAPVLPARRRRPGQRGQDRQPRKRRGAASDSGAGQAANPMNGAAAACDGGDEIDGLPHSNAAIGGGRGGGRSSGRGRGRGRNAGGRGRGRGSGVGPADAPQAANGTSTDVAAGNGTFQPTGGDPSATHAWSLTIGVVGRTRSVPSWWLSQVNLYMQTHDIRGAASFERGNNNQNLHIQAVMELTCGTDKASETAFKQHFRAFIPINPSDQGKLTFKPFAEGQTFVHMLGCVQKDLGKPHYKLVSHNVDPAELEEGRRAYADVSADYKTGKITISKAALPDRVYSFWFGNYRPFYVPMDVLLLHMLRSGKFAPCGTWCSVGHGHPADPAMQTAMQLIITRPHTTTLDSVRTLFFGMHKSGGKFRYHKDTSFDHNINLPPMLQEVSSIWHTHAYEIDTMSAVVSDLRTGLSLANIPFDDCSAIDQVFVECFDDSYLSVTGVDSMWRVLGSSGCAAEGMTGYEMQHDSSPRQLQLQGTSPQHLANHFHWYGADGEEIAPPAYN